MLPALHTSELSLQPRPQILDMIRSATTAGLLLEQPFAGAAERSNRIGHCLLLIQGDLPLGCICKKQPKQQTNRGSRQSKDTAALPSRSQQCQKSSRVAPLHRPGVDDSQPTCAPLRKSRLSAPQVQAQLSLISDRTRSRRLKHTLHTKGAWQQVTRIEDLCHSLVSQTRVRRPHTARLHRQRAKETRQQGSHGLWSLPSVWIILGLSTRTW